MEQWWLIRRRQATNICPCRGHEEGEARWKSRVKVARTGVDDGGGHVEVGVAGDDDEGDAQHRRQGGAVGRCGGVGHVEGEVVGAALKAVKWCNGVVGGIDKADNGEKKCKTERMKRVE